MIYRIGGRKPVRLNVRIIAMTNRDLLKMVRENTFREDLYYRLNVIPLAVPPLRERPEDILPLAQHFLACFSKKYSTRCMIGPEEEQMLLAYPWPGNVRELEHVLEYAVNMMPADGAIGIDCLPAKLLEDVRRQEIENAPQTPPLPAQTDSAEHIVPLAQLEERAIRAALEKFGKRTEGKKNAACALGLSLATFYRKIRSFSI